MDGNIVAKRLKKLRTDLKYSHEKLAEALQKKYNVQITAASLKKYEKQEYYKDITNKDGKTRRELYSAVKGMRIEYLYMFADFYGVPTDYILGRTGSPSPDLTEQALYDRYGLSMESLKNLEELWENGKISTSNEFFNLNSKEIIELNPAYILNCMLSNRHFIESYTIDLLRYYEIRYNKRNDIDENGHSDRANIFGIGMYRYIVLNHMEWFIENYYNDLVKKLQTLINGKGD